MAGPQKQFDTDAALNSALTVFWRQGYELTSMQDLVDAMGVNRASLYDTFGNKHELYKKALLSYKNNSLAMTREKLLNTPGAVRERLANYFYSLKKSHVAEQQHIGCFLNNTAVELAPHYPDIAELVREAWQEMEMIFKTVLDEGVAKKELPQNINTTAIAATINMMLQGISVMAKAGTGDKQLGQIIATVLGLLEDS